MKAFQVAPASKEKVEPEKRKAFRPSDVKSAAFRQFHGCAVCREYLIVFHADHVLARDLGGETTLANLQLLCPGCHAKKTVRDRKMIDRARRLRAREDGTRRPRKKIASRGFQKIGER